jgi:short-subunit dehydrogenase
MDVKNKVVIVTGASSGIGLELARILTKKGAKIALVSRSKDKLEELSGKLKDSIVIVCDMTKEEDIKAMVKKVKNHFGRIDILINNAGRGYYAPLDKTNLETLDELYKLNLQGPIISMMEVIPIMKDQKEGQIINISSGTALMYIPNMSIYSSLKRALVGISLTANEELKEYNIKVSVIYPTMTNTNFAKNSSRGDIMSFSGRSMPEGDTTEFIAEKIVDSISTNDTEIFAHDWMRENRK